MAVTVETYEKKYHLWDFKNPAIYKYVGLALLICCILVYKILGNQYFTYIEVVFLVSLLMLLVATPLFYINYESYKLIKTGTIKIDENHFLIDREIHMDFKNVDQLEIRVHDYKGRSKGRYSPRSLGADNTFMISYDGKIIERSFQLAEEREIHLVQFFLGRQIIKEKFPKLHPKKLVDFLPDTIKKSEEGRVYIAKKVKERKLNATQGLLMMGYNSDKEAKRLKEKYQI